VAYDNKSVNLPPITNIAAGQYGYSRINSGLRTKEFQITMTGTVTIAAGGATAILNDGSLAAIVNQVVLNENGDLSPCQTDARALSRATELYGAAPTSNKRLTAVAAGTYALRETIVIPFCTDLAINPWETPFTEKNPNAPTQVGLLFNPVSVTNMIGILATSANAVTLSNLTINVVQVFDKLDPRKYPPLFRASFRDITFPVVGATISDVPFYLQLTNPLRAMMIQQDSTPAASAPVTVSDQITAYQFITDTQKIDGEGIDLVFADQVQQQARHFGGAISPQRIVGNVSAVSTVAPFVDPSMLFRYFESSGRLSNILNPRAIGPNPRLLITGGAGAGTSPLVRVCLHELSQIQGLTAPKIPFAF